LPATSDAKRIAAAALAEDGEIDLTTEFTVAPEIEGDGIIEYRSGGVLAGTVYANAVAKACRCTIEWNVAEGADLLAGSKVGVIRGKLRHILRAERPLLNLLQRASGIASGTRAFVKAVEGTGCRILHTRKTAPGLRALDIAAVLAGGGVLHRGDLAHEVMVKDNHWQALGADGLRPALARAKESGVRELYVEVESVEQLELACSAEATRLLVDNQPPATVRDWGRRARALSPGIEIEATGGITLDNVRDYAEAGADYISIGALTHSVQAADLAIEVTAKQKQAGRR
jgi:nicotinate-nucleotide pyrophosphorylase (carboxylating)